MTWQVLAWAHEHAGYSMKHLTAIVMNVGAGAATLKKKEQQEIIAALQDLCAQQARNE